MTVTMRWFNDEHKIILFDFAGNWTWDEYQTAYDQSKPLLESVNYKVDFILETRNSRNIPYGAIGRLRQAAEKAHPNAGIRVFVGVPKIHQSLGQLFTSLYPGTAAKYPFRFAETVEEAVRLIEQYQKQNE